jgi:hypothetical protein
MDAAKVQAAEVHTIYGDKVTRVVGPHHIPAYVVVEVINPFNGTPVEIPIRRDFLRPAVLPESAYSFHGEVLDAG